MARTKITWAEWKYWTKLLYERNGFKGYPLAEFRNYFKRGYTPFSAYEAAKHRRKRAIPNV